MSTSYFAKRAGIALLGIAGSVGFGVGGARLLTTDYSEMQNSTESRDKGFFIWGIMFMAAADEMFKRIRPASEVIGASGEPSVEPKEKELS